MTVVGYSTLEVIPSVKGLAKNLERQTSGDLAAAGKKGGKRFGDAAGREAGGKFKSGLSSSLKGYAAPFAGILAGAGIADFFRDSFAEAKEAGQVSRVTAKLIETTGQAANLTATQVGALSEKLMEYAAVDDEMIQAGANVMLTFRNVKNAAGEGNNVFDRSIKAGLDLAAVLGTDLSSSAVQLGKALNDPVKGVTALGRAGVQFTVQQKEQIKALVESGDLLAAQKIVLQEIESQVGGAAGAAADGTDRLAVAMGNLKESFGQELMPAVEAFSQWAVSDGVPALSATGGAAKDLAQTIAGLPAPVLAGAGAFAALRIAAATSLGTAAAGGAAAVGSAMTGLRIRTMLAVDAFHVARSASITLTGPLAGVSLGAGRAAASMAGLRAASIGAGAAMAGGLTRSLALVGGPWGAALIAGTVLLTKFWGEHQEAKAHVDDLTSSLNKQTGEITNATKEKIAQALVDEGLIDKANKLGISLKTVTDAALGNAAAMDSLQAQERMARDAAVAHDEVISSSSANMKQRAGDLEFLVEGLRDESSELGKARRETGQLSDVHAAMGLTNDKVGGSFRSLSKEISGARTELQKLADAEAERALNAIQQRRDQIALRETLRAAKEEARDGKRVLDGGTKAADANMQALLDLADQWNTSGPKVRNAKGAYVDMRDEFFNVARQMGATKDRALELTDELLRVPKKAALEFQSKGFKERMAEIRALRREERRAFTFSVAYVNSQLAPGKTLAGYADGGRIGGVGSGTSDSNLALVSRGEWVIRERAAAYYGNDFMRRLNEMRLPKYANGGPVAAAPARPSGGGGVTITGGITVYADTYDDILRKASVKIGQSMGDGVRFGGQ